MITSNECLARYGHPESEKHMSLWTVPIGLQIPVIPPKIYCNNDFITPLTKAFKNIIDRKLTLQIKTWDGCFNIRAKKGGLSPSLHSWGLAVDINAAWNGFDKPSTMSAELVKCFTDAGFDWGGVWQKIDAMHFQLARLP